MGKSAGSGGDTETTIRYAPYIEAYHQDFLSDMVFMVDSMVWYSNQDDIGLSNDDFCDFLDDSFFTAGYTLTSFPSLFDMYGKFMAGLDVETLFDQMLSHDVEAAAIGNRVAAYSAELDEDLEENSWPRLAAGLRDINCVSGSNFMIAKASLEGKKATLLTTYDTELRKSMIGVAADRWGKHLTWNESTVNMYAQLYKLYYSLQLDIDGYDKERKQTYALWPFTLYEYLRLALGTLSGATNTKSSVEGANQSTGQKVLGGAMGGASLGMATGNPVAALAGGLIGGIAALF